MDCPTEPLEIGGCGREAAAAAAKRPLASEASYTRGARGRRVQTPHMTQAKNLTEHRLNMDTDRRLGKGISCKLSNYTYHARKSYMKEKWAKNLLWRLLKCQSEVEVGLGERQIPTLLLMPKGWGVT